MRFFNKFTPLEKGPFRDRVEALSKEMGYSTDRIFVIDGSRRSTKAGAFFTGFGKTKTIGLYDTLLEGFTEDETLCVIAHEIAHANANATRYGTTLTHPTPHRTPQYSTQFRTLDCSAIPPLYHTPPLKTSRLNVSCTH